MKTEAEIMSRKNWPPGEWDKEPDKTEFHHAGLPCLTVRGPLGAWCGYVGVPPEHPLHGTGYDDAHRMYNIDVHGGLTYASECQGKVCHTPKEGEPDDVWWLGFDCNHYQDTIPGMLAVRKTFPDLTFKASYDSHESYKNLGFVTGEVKRLAEQLAEVTA